ncbi:hypothetical protein V2J09_013932 [Rumex salicifolius]
MRPVFVGNFGYDTRQWELERLFLKYGRVDRIDMKLGYAFVYFEDDRDGADAIHYLDNMPFGHDRRHLSVEWARGEKGKDVSKMGNQRPTKTLFVINFDPIETRVRDLEKHFETYGKIVNARIRRNFAFVQFETQEEATRALECTHLSKLLDRVISVEYALRDDDERDESPRRGSYARRGYNSPYGQSPSPSYRRRSPGPGYRRRSPSPGYRRRSPSPIYRNRPSPDYGYDRYDDHHAYGRRFSPEQDQYHRSKQGKAGSKRITYSH